MFLSLVSKAQPKDSLNYYESLENKENKIIDKLLEKARHSRHGVLALCIDSTNKPIVGLKLSIDSVSENDSTHEWKNISLGTAITDENGTAIFNHNNYNVSVDIVDEEKYGSFEYSAVGGGNDTIDGDCVLRRLSLTDKKNKKNYRRIWQEANASNVSNLHDTNINGVKKFLLIDSTTKTKFILDSTQIYITAIDSNGKQLWRTDPWKDNKLMVYRIKRPIIVHFRLGYSAWSGKTQIIGIRYDNSQFGFIDKLTGKFTWLGQD